MEKETVRWGVISQGGRFYPAKDKEQAAKWAAYSYGEDDYSQSLSATVAIYGAVIKPVEHTKHRLWFRAVGMTNILVDRVPTLVPQKFRLERLDPTPPLFRYIEGSYAEISIEAGRLNKLQTQANYHDYLYFPEPVGEDDDFAENVDLEALWLLPSYEKDLEDAA